MGSIKITCQGHPGPEPSTESDVWGRNGSDLPALMEGYGSRQLYAAKINKKLLPTPCPLSWVSGTSWKGIWTAYLTVIRE